METPQDTGEICTGILAGFDDCRLFGIVDAVIDYSSSFWNSLNFSRARVLTNLAFLIVDVGSTVEAFETLSAGGVASGIALFFPPAEVATCSVTAIGAIECVGAIVLSVNDVAKIDKSYGEFSDKLVGKYKPGDKTPGGREFTDHGAQRANKRNFDAKDIDNIIDNNKKKRVKEIDEEGQVQWRYQDKRGNTVVTDEWTERIVSVYSHPKSVNDGKYITKK